MWQGASTQYSDALRHAYRMTARVDAQRGGQRLGPDVVGEDYYNHGLPLGPGGKVIVDTTSRVRRQLELSLADTALSPRDARSPLAPYGTELVVQYGIIYPSEQVEWVPLIVAQIEAAGAELVGGEVRIVAPDRSRAVADAQFMQPRASDVGLTIPLQIARLVTEVIDVEVIDLTHSTAVVPRTTWEVDRWGAIEELSTSIGAETIFDPQGRCVIRPVPSWTALPSWYVTLGQDGTVITGEHEMSRAEVFNAAVVRGERADDAPPIYASAVDNDPTSPTWFYGDFGPKPYPYSSNLITTYGQAMAAATGLLARKRMGVREVAMRIGPVPMLDGGDILALQRQDYTSDRLSAVRFEVPLDTDTMSLTARSGQVSTEAPSAPPLASPAAITQTLIGAYAAAREGRTQLEEFLRLETASEVTFGVRRSYSTTFPATFGAHEASADVGYRASVASVRSDPSRMAAGLDDDLVRDFVESIPDGHTVYLAWQDEAELPGRRNKADVIRKGGARFAKLVKEARGARPVYVTWIVQAWSFAPASGRDITAWYPGDAHIEVIAVNAFNTSQVAYRGLDHNRYMGVVQAVVFARSRGRRFGVASWANYDTPGANRPAFITNGVAYLRSLASPMCEFAPWFHSGEGSDADTSGWWLDNSDASLDAWKDAIT